MNRRQKLVQKQFLNNEQSVINRLEKVHDQALKDINDKISKLTFTINDLKLEYSWMDDNDPEKARVKSMIQSKIYQRQYQEQLKKQVDGILQRMHVAEFTNISDYLDTCYTDGWIGTFFDAHGQGVPIVAPINQESMVRAVQLESKISKGLYTRLGEDVDLLKKKITAQVSRSIATGMTYAQTAKALEGYTRIGYNRAIRIARTEGHRIQTTATMDAMTVAKEKGADVVKQWDATLDNRTRESHVAVDGEIRELDKPFSNGLDFPGDPDGGAVEVINCRCALLQRARWAVDGEFTKFNNITKELETFNSPDDYAEFKKGFFTPENKQYMDYVGQMEKKYGTKDFTKVLDQMSDREYKHFSELMSKDPVFGKPDVLTLDQVNAQGTVTLGDIYERHRINNNLRSTPYGELKDNVLNPISADYEGMSVESAKVFNDTIKELAAEYDTPLQKVRVMNKDEWMFNNSSFAYVSHNYSVDSAELVINQAKCKDIGDLSNRVKELSSKGYCAKIPDELADRYIVTHEFAHTIINVKQPLDNNTNWVGADYKKIKTARKEIETVYEEYMVEVRSLTELKKKYELEAMTTMDEVAWKKAAELSEQLRTVKISEYSLQNPDEFMAEAFTNERIGVSSNPYGKKVMDILDKHFKR